jgi:hypothetical protein
VFQLAQLRNHQTVNQRLKVNRQHLTTRSQTAALYAHQNSSQQAKVNRQHQTTQQQNSALRAHQNPSLLSRNLQAHAIASRRSTTHSRLTATTARTQAIRVYEANRFKLKRRAAETRVNNYNRSAAQAAHLLSIRAAASAANARNTRPGPPTSAKPTGPRQSDIAKQHDEAARRGLRRGNELDGNELPRLDENELESRDSLR